MDPYIEACGLWADFHFNLIAEITRALTAVVPERYLVRTGERSYVAEAGAVSMVAFLAEQFREQFVEIYEDDPELLLVTCIEVLSPTNKRRGTEGWEQYLRKRQGLLLGQANLVEIDLLRGGQRMPMLTPWPASPYTLLVARKERAPRCSVWPASFQHPLPRIPVPLSYPDADIPLDHQPMIETIYPRSRYYRSIDCSKPLTPPLTPDEVTWLRQRLLDHSAAKS
jgi:hypothetical protein